MLNCINMYKSAFFEWKRAGQIFCFASSLCFTEEGKLYCVETTYR